MFTKLKNNSNYLCLIILVIIFTKAFSFIFDAKIDLNGDNIEYFTYAKAILEGGYTNLMSPSNYPTNNFPPGYPLLLSFLMIFTKSIVALKIYTGIMFLGGILLLFLTLSKNEKNNIWIYLAFGIATLINPDVLDFATMLMSEMAYILFIGLTAFFLYKSNDNNPLKDKYFWLMIASAAYAYHIRTAAVAIMGGVMLHYLFSMKWKHLGLSVVGFIAGLMPWMIRNKIQNIGPSRYISQMTQVNAWDKNAGTLDAQGMLGRFWDNFCAIFTKQVPDALFAFEIDYNAPASLGEWIFGLILVAIIFWGLFNVKRLNFFFIGLLIATGATLLPWNGGGGTRYVIGIIPILYLGLFLGIFYLGKLILKSDKISTALVYVALLFTFISVKPELEYLNKYAESPVHPAYGNYFKIAEAIKKNTPKDTYICCRKPALFYFYADRATGRYTFSPDDAVMIKHMYKAGFDYVVLEQLGYGSTPKYLYPTITKNPEIFKVVMHLQNPDTYLLQFDRRAAKEKFEIKDE